MPTQIRKEQIQDLSINNSKQSFGKPKSRSDVSTKEYTDQTEKDIKRMLGLLIFDLNSKGIQIESPELNELMSLI